MRGKEGKSKCVAASRKGLKYANLLRSSQDLLCRESEACQGKEAGSIFLFFSLDVMQINIFSSLNCDMQIYLRWSSKVDLKESGTCQEINGPIRPNNFGKIINWIPDTSLVNILLKILDLKDLKKAFKKKKHHLLV